MTCITVCCMVDMSNDTETHAPHGAVTHGPPCSCSSSSSAGCRGPTPGSMATAGEKSGGKTAPKKSDQILCRFSTKTRGHRFARFTGSTSEPIAIRGRGSSPRNSSRRRRKTRLDRTAGGGLWGKFDAAADFAVNEAALAVSFRLKQILLEAPSDGESQLVGCRKAGGALIEESPADASETLR